MKSDKIFKEMRKHAEALKATLEELDSENDYVFHIGKNQLTVTNETVRGKLISKYNLDLLDPLADTTEFMEA